MAIKWNQIEFARSNIFTGAESFTKKEFFSLMELAMVENRHDFVDLLIENNIDLKNFLTQQRLLFLYNCDQVK